VDVNVDLPEEMRISADAEILERGGFYTSKLFDETVIETVYLDFPQQDYWNQLTSNYDSKTPVTATLRYKDKTLEQVGVRFRGMTSYLLANDKKSFDIDLEWQIDGQDINGYNSLKLNNGYEDHSAMREVLYSNLARKNIPSAKANFVNLVINGRNFGVYANVQKLNKDHAKEWFLDKDATRWRAEAPGGGGFGGGGFGGFGGGGFGGAFGAGTSTLNDLGAEGSAYENAYTLKHSAVENPWQDLANAAHTMGVASPEYLVEELSQYMDIDAALWFIATENIFTDDDSYVNKGGMDYYVYFDIATGRIVPLEYDGNSAMSAQLASNWGPLHKINDANFPLMNVLLNIPELRQRYLAHYRTILEESFNPTQAQAKIDQYAQLIDTYIAAPDAVRQYTYAQYQAGVQTLKSFFTTRHQFLQNHSDLRAPVITISDVVDSVDGRASVRPTDSQSVEVSAQVGGEVNIRGVNLYYGSGLMGEFSKVAMTSSGNGAYRGVIPPFPKGTFVRYYVEAVADNSAATVAYSPKGAEHDVYIYQVLAAQQAASPVVINELMPSNKATVTDETGAYSDWLELYNNSDQPVDLSGWFLTDEDTNLERWAFPAGTVIAARDTLVVWADDAASPGLHADFKLSASGETIYLVTPQKTFADQVTFADAEADFSYARSPNGTGGWNWTDGPSFDATN
jgi:spore coat protein CotH